MICTDVSDILRRYFSLEGGVKPPNHKRKGHLLLLLLPILFLLMSVPAYSMTIDLSQPERIRYTYSIDIPLEFTEVDADTCTLGVHIVRMHHCEDEDPRVDTSIWQEMEDNYTVDCDDNVTTFDLPYDAVYNLTFYVTNASHTVSDNVLMCVGRTEDFQEAKPLLMVGLVLIFITLGMCFIFISSKYNDEDHQVVKGGLILGAFMSLLFSITLINLIVREYIKIPQIQTTVEYFYMFILTFLVILFFWTFYVILKHAMERIKQK